MPSHSNVNKQIDDIDYFFFFKELYQYRSVNRMTYIFKNKQFE